MQPNADITIWNKYQDRFDDKWKRTVIHNVHWSDERGAKVTQQGFSQDNSITCYVMATQSEVEGEAVFVEPVDFSPVDNVWTCSEGDFIARGIYEDEEPPTKRAFVILAHTDNNDIRVSPGLRHIEILAE